MITFQNDGELDIRCVTTMGVNVKETNNPIGQFGTGLKYAIATLLRNGCDVEIRIGEKVHNFYTAGEEIRGINFNIVHMEHNGEVRQLGFTTDLGKNWEPWMAYRELYSNMLDEPNAKLFSSRKQPCLVKGKTQVVIKGNEINKVHANRHLYFLQESERKPAYSTSNVDIYEKITGQEATIFYRGIRVAKSGQGAIFDYNLKEETALTEDRTLRYGWEPQWNLSRAMLRLDGEKLWHKDLLKTILTAPYGTFEAQVDYVHAPASPTDFFLDVVEQLRDECPNDYINPSALALLYKIRKNKALPKESIKLNNVQQAQLDRAVAFCKNVLEFDNLDDYPIIVVNGLGKGHLGRGCTECKAVFTKRKPKTEGRFYEIEHADRWHCKRGYGLWQRYHLKDFSGSLLIGVEELLEEMYELGYRFVRVERIR